MKKQTLFLACLFTVTFLQSCFRDQCTSTQEYLRYDPVMMSASEFRKDIKTEDSRPLENPGKIYFYDKYLLINEMGRGIHFYDLSNAQNPVKVVFYDIPGNFDMAIKNNILYVDNVVDLVSIDISDVVNPKTIHRVENYNGDFPQQNDMYRAYDLASKVTTVLDCSNSNFGQPWFWDNGGIFVLSEGDFNPSVINSNNSSGIVKTGVGGSFSRFTLYDDYLYTVNNSSLSVWSAKNSGLDKLGQNQFSWGIETIFPYKDKLFIGSNTGMFIFDNSNPVNPVLKSVFNHAQACDPVVVEDDIAYVTLREGNNCRGAENELDVIDIKSISDPKLIKAYPMKNPHGLAVKDKKIYLCEGSFGFKVLDANDALNVEEVNFDESIKSYDVIALNDNRLFVIGSDGFYQFDNSDPKNLILLSKIPIHTN